MPIRKSTSSLSESSVHPTNNTSSQEMRYPFSVDDNGGETYKRVNLNLRDRSNIKDDSNKKKYALILTILLIALSCIGGYFYLFSASKSSLLNPIFTGIVGEDSEGISADNMFTNPINGMLIPNSQATEFKDRKPIAVMINNYEIARPSAGLSKAV